MELLKRKSPRIPGYSYATPNYYFVTICTHEKRCIFGEPNTLNLFGRYAEESLRKIALLYPGVQVDKYVVMPNHVHAIVVLPAEATEKQNLNAVIGQNKMSVTKRIHSVCGDMKVWQRSYHDHVIRNQRSYENIWTYIDNNPLKWEEDCFHPAHQKT